MPEAAVLRVTVISTDPVRYQPVVSVLDPALQEVGCGLANDVRQGATANATAYVTPAEGGDPAIYLVRVAEVANNSPSGGLPTLTVRFAARDVTAPHIKVTSNTRKASPLATSYDAVETTDKASGLDISSARWEFHDRLADKRDVVYTVTGKLQATHVWRSPGAHEVTFSIRDNARNENMYRFTTLAQDTVRPDVTFSLRPPEPGARRLRVTVKSSESVSVRLLVTQVGRKSPLLRRNVKFWGDKTHSRSVPLRGGVRRGLLVISGVARDLAGNTTALPQCVVDPVTGQGACTSP